MSNKRLVAAALMVSLASIAFAQQPPQAPPHPKALTPQQQLPIVKAACPGKAWIDRDTIACTACPVEGKAPDAREWRAAAIYVGHFLSADAESAVVSAPACTANNGFPGGSAIVLENKSGAWQRVTVHTAPGVAECHAFAGGDGRDLLLCLAEHHAKHRLSGSGTVMDTTDSVLYALDYGKESAREVFSVSSTPGSACKAGFEWESHVEKVDFPAPSADGSRSVVITYTRGEVELNADQRKTACPNNPPKPALKRWQEQYLFDGESFELGDKKLIE